MQFLDVRACSGPQAAWQVAAIGAGTGPELPLLKAQNATGIWGKVT